MAHFVGDVGELLGFDALITNTAKEFQEIYLARQPSAIVIDIVMPDQDGIELIHYLSENNCLAPIILMSGYDVLYLETAKKLGSRKGCHIAGTLSKPFTVEEIEPLLKKMLHK